MLVLFVVDRCYVRSPPVEQRNRPPPAAVDQRLRFDLRFERKGRGERYPQANVNLVGIGDAEFDAVVEVLLPALVP